MNQPVEIARDTDSRGFGLVEVIVAMFLLAVFVIGVLPPMMEGIRASAEQSSVATATRFLNSLVEQARDEGGCVAWPALVSRTEQDSRGLTLTASGSCTTDAAGTIDTLKLDVNGAGRVLASTSALIYTP